MGSDEATEGKILNRQFPWTWKEIEYYLRDRMQKTLQVELGLSKNREPWHWETTATLEILEQRRSTVYT
jgi:hypothetical protein